MCEYIITSVKQKTGDIFDCSFSQGNTFFIRTYYLHDDELSFMLSNFVSEITISSEQFEKCLKAGLIYSAERCAMQYLSRCEHSAFLLRRKLLNKEHESEYIDEAFDFLINKEWLSDSRYASSFLRNRGITHCEGYSRLLSELISRGVSKEIAEESIQNYFLENPEYKLLEKAYKKLERLGKKDEKLTQALIRRGFSLQLIKKYMKKIV